MRTPTSTPHKELGARRSLRGTQPAALGLSVGWVSPWAFLDTPFGPGFPTESGGPGSREETPPSGSSAGAERWRR
jgi:hypothetical protein